MLGNRLLCVLDRDGTLAGPMPEFARDPVELLRLYRALVLTRTFDTKAIARARRGLDPTLIEALTYRLCDHTTSDDASRYRDDAEVSGHWPAEPVARLRKFLTNSGHWGKDMEEALLHECSSAVEGAAEAQEG